jgi:hypothetical protein
LLLFAGTASASTITSLVGDIDGFGGVTAPGAEGVSTGPSFDNRTGSDPLFTDVYLFEQNGGVGGSPITFSHVYGLIGSATSAMFEIMTAGMADGRGPWDVVFNGSKIGEISTGTSVNTLTKLHSFSVATGLLTGNDTVSLVYQSSAGEGFAIDYAKLTVETAPPIPLPAGLPLLATGLLAFGLLRRRKG